MDRAVGRHPRERGFHALDAGTPVRLADVVAPMWVEGEPLHGSEGDLRPADGVHETEQEPGLLFVIPDPVGGAVPERNCLMRRTSTPSESSTACHRALNSDQAPQVATSPPIPTTTSSRRATGPGSSK